ncbi:M2 family metallopeptidase [Tumebacillus permanentifrigoris]|uniref:Peptidyl-dipeptidase A n=1 Tax=Tumebacillus permanentifrigoris TaxID=378543 RepID=A0A316D8W7_9BACL|nr:M2 family metallopeptidase [Tumebacillus permanentifrigoris]PWK13419.1 peptidyl-dipeptidase A [Tumebacillus permanentifrigoris]
MNTRLQQFLDNMVPRIADLHKRSNDAYWKATTTGNPADEERYADLRSQLLKLYADREAFADLKEMRESGQVTEPLLARQLDVLYTQFAEQQIDEADIEELVRRETEIEGRFTMYRATIDGEKVSDNEIHDILANVTDSEKRRAAWEASKQIGPEVAGKVVELVKFRNQIASKLGYANYYEMSLEFQEIDKQELFDVLGQLEAATRAPFAAMKAELDAELAARCGIAPDEMRPWHYADPFFQEAPASEAVDLNQFFAAQDVVALSKVYFDGVGLDIQDILDRSDLYEREGKNQHAYCTDIDREGDVRILCNVRPNEYWMATMLHELGHGVYDKNYDEQLPWLLRGIAHILTTEAIAMLFGRLTKDADWLTKIAGVPAEQAQAVSSEVAKQLTRAMLIFVRWGLVMTHFERDMYQNPDQDLNTLWWDYVERFQMVKRVEGRNAPDWAAKIHLGTAPVYYQNYILGELCASQFLAAMERDLQLTSVTQDPRIGQWLTDKVFKPGARYQWNEMITQATGLPLTPKFFVEQFVTA